MSREVVGWWMLGLAKATAGCKLFIAHEFVMSNHKTHKFYETLQLDKARLESKGPHEKAV